MNWKEVRVTTSQEAEEAVVNLFYEAGAKGTAVESAANLSAIRSDKTVNYVEDRILAMDPNMSYVAGYFPDDENFEAQLQQIKQGLSRLPEWGLDPGARTITVREMAEEDWANSWKQFYKPTKIGDKIVIKPTWEPYTAQGGEMIVNMDPGMAFGTGTHETTQLCVLALEKYLQPNDLVYDVGCGSGILSIVAGKLGAKKVVGVDFDPVAVDAARSNAALNDLSKAVCIKEGDLLEVIPQDHLADLVVSNILAEVIICLVDSIRLYLKDEGIFIASGIIHEHLDEVKDALKAKAFDIVATEAMGEWDAVIARKRAQ